MATDLIRYDLLVQDALRSVVRKVLGDTARSGLAGEHHFNIAFKTQAPGVVVPPGMRQRFPDEMSIILQHEFWDLAVTLETFEVSLNFSRRPERLTIPFDAITGFTDPSVPFGFKLEPRAFEAPAASPSPQAQIPAPVAKLGLARPEAAKSDGLKPEPPKSEPAKTQPSKPKPASAAEPTKSGSVGGKAADPSADPKVVSIDAFRKK